MAGATHAVLAIRNGKVSGVCVIEDDDIMRDALASWALDDEVREIIRVPIEIARRSFDVTAEQVRAMLAGDD